MLHDLVWAWAVVAILAVLWVVMGAMLDWSGDITVSLLQALGYRCTALWRGVKRLCGMTP